MSSTGGWRSRLHRLCPRSLVRRESTSYLVLPFRYGHHKSAHAASAEIPNENQASSSNSHSQPPHDYSHPRKGKQRDQDSYRFPARGSRGGLPDPFEVLGLDRSASDKEIKQQCETRIDIALTDQIIAWPRFCTPTRVILRHRLITSPHCIAPTRFCPPRQPAKLMLKPDMVGHRPMKVQHNLPWKP